MDNRQYYVYILFNKKNGTLYEGLTNNLVKHWSIKTKYTLLKKNMVD